MFRRVVNLEHGAFARKVRRAGEKEGGETETKPSRDCQITVKSATYLVFAMICQLGLGNECM